MGEAQKTPLRMGFDGSIKLEFHGAKLTSDAGLLVYRELDDAVHLTASAAGQLTDVRTGSNTQHSLMALLRQSICVRSAIRTFNFSNGIVKLLPSLREDGGW